MKIESDPNFQRNRRCPQLPLPVPFQSTVQFAVSQERCLCDEHVIANVGSLSIRFVRRLDANRQARLSPVKPHDRFIANHGGEIDRERFHV